MSIRKYLMFDRKWIKNSDGFDGGRFQPEGTFSFKVSQPQKAIEPFLQADQPWESMAVGWATMLYDNGKYRLWYEAMDLEYKNDLDSRLCYAESPDGIHWEKPHLGLVEYHGSKENNIVFTPQMGGETGFHGHCVWIDPTSPPQARYRMSYLTRTMRYANIAERASDIMSFAFSADGIHWKWGFPQGNTWLHYPYTNFGSDTQSVIFWDPQNRQYAGYFRNWDGGYGRTIARSITNDLANWPMPETILQVDDEESFGKDFYNTAASYYESEGDFGYFFFISEFNHETDSLDVSLATSRDGRIFSRIDRERYLSNGKSFDRGAIYMCPGIINDGENCRMIYHGRDFKHGEARPNMIQYAGCYNMLHFQQDRLQGLKTENSFAFNLSPFVYEGGKIRIELNACVEQEGQIKGGLVFEKEYLPGFTLDQCKSVKGDGLHMSLEWQEQTLPSRCDNQAVELRLVMETATLYSVRIVQM